MRSCRWCGELFVPPDTEWSAATIGTDLTRSSLNTAPTSGTYSGGLQGGPNPFASVNRRLARTTAVVGATKPKSASDVADLSRRVVGDTATSTITRAGEEWLINWATPDGGDEPPMQFRSGDRVIDRDDIEDDGLGGAIMVVLRPAGGVASEVTIDQLDKTVAEVNPSYPSDDRVVQVAYANSLDANVPGWRGSADAALDAKLAEYRAEWGVSVRRYSFPESRLRLAKRAELEKHDQPDVQDRIARRER